MNRLNDLLSEALIRRSQAIEKVSLQAGLQPSAGNAYGSRLKAVSILSAKSARIYSPQHTPRPKPGLHTAYNRIVLYGDEQICSDDDMKQLASQSRVARLSRSSANIRGADLLVTV